MSKHPAHSPRAASQGSSRGAPKSAPSGALRSPSEGPAPSKPPRKRAEKSAARRDAIVAAALAEFCERGYAATRLDDVAKRAGVAKGTIYLNFRDKEALFQEIVVTMMVPVIAPMDAPPPQEMPTRLIVEAFAHKFIREVYGTERRHVLRLIMTEGPRFPSLAEHYYRNVVERAVGRMRALLERGLARGEIADRALIEYPQLVVAPMMMIIIWGALFERYAPLDIEGLVKTHLDILFGKARAS
jgi:AcrR family transcriptional regulator